jgi:hypothetical protein
MANEKDLNRRDFLITGAAGLTALGSVAYLGRPEFVMGANDRVRVAICGVRGRGGDHLHNFAQLPNVQIAALCDIDENVLRQRLAQMEKMGLPKPATYTYVRKLLEDKTIDARHPKPLALLNWNLGVPGGQRCLRGKTVLSQPVGGQATGESGPTVQPHRPARNAEPLRNDHPRGGAEVAGRHCRGDVYGSRALL